MVGEEGGKVGRLPSAPSPLGRAQARSGLGPTGERQLSLWFVVSGGRYYSDYDHVERVLNEERPAIVVQGECPTRSQGADGLAKRWCRKNGVPCIGMEAMWTFYGRGAGPIRNGWMFDLLPIYKLIAFPGGQGTDNAVQQAIEREICVRDERRHGKLQDVA